MDSSPDPTHCSRQEDELAFAKTISEAIRRGFAFVPFVGAGFSVASGIPATPAMARYLEYCMLAVFGLVPERRRRPWAPRLEQWPSVAAWSTDDLPTTGRIHEVWQRALALHSDDYLLQEAYGSLADWRSALRFFSRVDSAVASRNEDKPAKVTLGASDPSIIDSFFRALMERRRPALTHKMLHSLSTVLRCDVLLTTNFDDLIERAFQDAGNPLSVYEVPTHDPLPTANFVLRERTLVKMHGGKFWLRANDSLDEPPSREDVRNFLGYLAGRPLRSDSQAVGDDLAVDDRATALLVCGLSVNDKRIKHLLSYALAWMPNLHIYWLGFVEQDAFSANDVARLASQLAAKRAELSTQHATPEGLKQRVHVHLHPNAGLFFLRLFQVMTNALPPSGAIFPALWNLATPPRFFAPTNLPAINKKPTSASNKLSTLALPKSYDSLKLDIQNRIRLQLVTYSRGQLRATLPPLLIAVNPKCNGGLAIARAIHEERSWGGDSGNTTRFHERVSALWIDLDDIVQPAGFFLRLTLMIAHSCGEPDPISRINIDDYYDESPNTTSYKEFREAIADGIARLARESGAIWLISINAKENPGCNSLFRHEPIDGTPHDRPNPWDNPHFAARFADTIQYLVAERQLPLQFVFVSYASTDNCQQHPCIASVWTMFSGQRENGFTIKYPYINLPADALLLDRAMLHISDALSRSCDSTPSAWNNYSPFLTAYAIAVFRIARYPVAILEVLLRLAPHCEALSVAQPTDDAIRRELKTELALYTIDPRRTRRGFGLLREKEGGFLWIHLDARQELLQRLHKALGALPEDASLVKRTLTALTLRLHWYAARWYGRLLLSSLDPLAATQAIDHIFRGLEFAAQYAPEVFEAELEECGNVSVRRLPIVMVRHARHVLGVAESLFARRLSDQFANLALEALWEVGLPNVRTHFMALTSRKPTTFRLTAQVRYELARVELQILRMYTTLQRKSGRFTRLLGCTFGEFENTVLRKLQHELKESQAGAVTTSGGATAEAVSTPIGDPQCASAEPRLHDDAVWLTDIRSIKLDIANCLLCSRRYGEAETRLYQLLADITGPAPSGLLPITSSKDVDRRCDELLDWAVGSTATMPKPPEAHLSEVVQILERLMYLEMHRSQAVYLARSAASHIRTETSKDRRHRLLPPQTRRDEHLEAICQAITDNAGGALPTPVDARKEHLARAVCWGHTGLKLLRHLAIADGQRVYIDNVRLRAHHALCEALLAAHDRKASPENENVRKAKRLLAEAQAYLDEFPLKHAGKLRAVFELRCAEISILEASVAINSTARSRTIGADAAKERLRPCLAHAYDALRAVRRAEVVLEDHRKSRWWWWILLVLKTKACEYLYRVRRERMARFLLESPDRRLSEDQVVLWRNRLSELRRQIPPFALQFLREELTAKVIDAQMVDPLFLARVVHSFRKICEHDLSFERLFHDSCKSLSDSRNSQVMFPEGVIPEGPEGRSRVRLTNARHTLRTLTERLERLCRSLAPGELSSQSLSEIDSDSLNYSRLVAEQARWDVEYEAIWKA